MSRQTHLLTKPQTNPFLSLQRRKTLRAMVKQIWKGKTMTDQLGYLEKDRLITAKDVQAFTGIRSRATLWRKSRNDNDGFPKPYRDGSHFTRWKLSEIQDWIESLKTD